MAEPKLASMETPYGTLIGNEEMWRTLLAAQSEYAQLLDSEFGGCMSDQAIEKEYQLADQIYSVIEKNFEEPIDKNNSQSGTDEEEIGDR